MFFKAKKNSSPFAEAATYIKLSLGTADYTNPCAIIALATLTKPAMLAPAT